MRGQSSNAPLARGEGSGRDRKSRSVVLTLFAAFLTAVCSPEAAATGPPAPPLGLRADSVSRTSVLLSWYVSPRAVRGAGFRVFVNGALSASVRRTTFRVGGLNCGTSYVFAVSTYDRDGRRSKLLSRRLRTSQCGSCFPRPGSCGYPDPAYHNVGIPRGARLRKSGSIILNKNGAVVTGLDVTGDITVNADNVTIEDTRVAHNPATGGFAISAGQHQGLTIKDSEITGGDVFGAKNYLRVYMHNCAECAQYPDEIKDSYFKVDAIAAGAHYEAVYDNSAALDVEHTTILNPHEQTATIFMDTSDPDNVPCESSLTVNDSLLAGGGYLIYPCANSSSAGSSHATITNNRFARCRSHVVAAGSGYICRGYGSASGDGDVVATPTATVTTRTAASSVRPPGCTVARQPGRTTSGTITVTRSGVLETKLW